MLPYIARKLLWTLPVLFAATTSAFLVLHLIPGDPVNLMLSGRPASETVRENLRAKLGLNHPLPEQYAHFVVHAAQGDFGQSFATGQSVSQVIGQQLPASLQLAAGGFAIGIGGGLLLGVAAGLYPNTAIDAGANRINFLIFTLRDETQARSKAIALAAKDAQAQAESLARSLGVKLGPVVKATTQAEERPMPLMRTGATFAMGSSGAPTPVQPNEVTVPATVSITYQIE